MKIKEIQEELDNLKQSILDLSHPNIQMLLKERNEARAQVADLLAANEGRLNLLKSLVYFHDTDDTPAHDYWQDARAIIAIARAEK